MYRKTLYAAAALLLMSSCLVMASWSQPELVNLVSSPYNESGAFLSHDGLALYFSRGGCPEHYYFQLYKATRDVPYGPFTSVSRINDLAYSGGHCGSPWVSPDNLRMYYYRTEPGSIWRLKMSQRTSESAPWGAPVNLAELNTFSSNMSSPTLSANELVIVFEIPTRDWVNSELYMATRDNKNAAFGPIRTLTELNSPVNDSTPFLSDDGLIIFFSSNRSGASLVYKATRPSRDVSFGSPELVDIPAGYGAPRLSANGHEMFLGGGNWDVYVAVQNTAPTANAGDDQCLYAGLEGVVKVTLDGSKSVDPENDTLTYTWTYDVNGTQLTADGATPEVNLPTGEHVISLVVSDGEFDSEPDTVVVMVVPPLKVDLKLLPQSINSFDSSGLLNAKFAFSPQLRGEQIDPYASMCINTAVVKPQYANLFIYTDRILRFDVGFARSVIGQINNRQNQCEITIWGKFKSGRIFYGTDTIHVVNGNGRNFR